MSHCCFVFLDDGISGHPERVSASAASLLHQKDLGLGGLKLNREKSMLEPMQVGQWLGFVIDTIKMQFRVAPKKIAKLKSNLDSMISSGSATFRGLARVASFINSLYLAVGPIARLFMRQMHATIQARSFWDCSFSLSSPLSEELRFMLPILGGYIREVALFALCCASLLITGPVWLYFAFLIFAL